MENLKIEFVNKFTGEQIVKQLELTTYGKKYCTGDFVVSYWDDANRMTVTKTMTLQETLTHINVVGHPFNIRAVTVRGGETFTKLLSRWDEEKQMHWYVIAQLQGDYIVKEKSI
jgi:hypothetical protein